MNYLGFIKLLTADHTDYSAAADSVRARQTAEAQVRIYQDLLSLAGSIKWPGASSDRASVQHIRSQMPNIIRERIEMREADKIIRISSPLPVIDEAEFEAWRRDYRTYSAPNRLEAQRASAFIIAGVLHEGFERQGMPKTVLDQVEPDVITAMQRYSELKHWDEQLSNNGSNLASNLKMLTAQSEAYANAINAERDQYKEDATVRITHLKMLQEKSEGIEASLSEIELRLQESEETSQKRISDLEASIRAELELNTMRVLWKERAEEAQRALWISLGVVGVMALTAFAFVFCFGHAVIDFISPFNLNTILLNSSAAGAISQQLGRVVIVSIPAIVYFWMMKIAVRFIIRSLLLMDDARQRQTIMDSYFLLTKEGRSDERALPMMLWALFRQVPGHGSDGIEPPDFTEAINAGLKGSPLSKIVG